MLRIKNLRNKYQKRLIRPLYAQTQATPYAASIADEVRTAVTTGVWTGLAGGTPFTYKGGLVPGTVMVAYGEKVTVAKGGTTQANFGLLANFVGGELDDLGDELYVGVWRGPDSVYEILAPGFDDTGLQAAWNTANSAANAGVPVPLYASTTGLLQGTAAGGRQLVANLIERPNANRIIVDLKV
jgi:hypothetical protein